MSGRIFSLIFSGSTTKGSDKYVNWYNSSNEVWDHPYDSTKSVSARLGAIFTFGAFKLLPFVSGTRIKTEFVDNDNSYYSLQTNTSPLSSAGLELRIGGERIDFFVSWESYISANDLKSSMKGGLVFKF